MAIRERQHHTPLEPTLNRLRDVVARPASGIWIARLLLITLIGVPLWIALAQFTPPSVIPATAAPTLFSGERAMNDLNVIAQAPRPMGSAAHAATEQYLIDSLTALGLQPQIQATTGVALAENGDVWAGSVRNIVARIQGTDSSRAILLAAHYDTVPTGPGAGDCGSCVATVLETVRALRAGPPLKNDVIVLFVDAEEHDMLGAKTFMAEHPWAKDVGVAFNFEAIGTNGASMLSYTGPDNGGLTNDVLRASPHPLVSSFMTSLGLGMDTVQYVSKGAAGFEFVIFGGVQAYHSALDSVQRIHSRSLQHNGSYLLAATRQLGNQDLTINTPGDQVFFNVSPDHAIRYPVSWVIPLTSITLLLLASVLVLGFRRGRLTGGGVALGSAAFFGGVVGAAGLVTLAEWGLRNLNPNYQVFMGGMAYHDGLLLLAFVALAVTVMLAVQAWLRRRCRAADLAAGAAIWWALLLIATSFLVPGVSYLFTWPLFGLALALGFGFLLLPDDDQRGFTWRPTLVAALALIPAILLLVPVVIWSHAVASYVELPTRLNLAALPVLFVALGLGLVLPLVPLPTISRRWMLPAFSGLAALACIMMAVAVSGFSTDQPRPDQIAYVLDADTGQATWVSVGKPTDEWTKQFFTNGFQRTEFVPLPSELPEVAFAALQAAAPAVDLPAPELTLVDSTTSGNERALHLHLTSPRHAPNVQVAIESASAIAQAAISGKPVDLGDGSTARTSLTMQYYGLPSEGIDLTLVVRGAEPVRTAVEERSNGLPEVPGMTIQPRPASTMPAPFENADPTIVRKTFTFSSIQQ